MHKTETAKATMTCMHTGKVAKNKKRRIEERQGKYTEQEIEKRQGNDV